MRECPVCGESGSLWDYDSGWFCAHYYTHQNSDDPRAKFAKERILEISGEKNWDDLTAKLRSAKKDLSKHDTLYLEALKIFLVTEIDKLKEGN